MKLINSILLLSVGALVGCTSPTLYLIDKSNKEAIVTYSTWTNSMEVTQGGVLYKGKYITDTRVVYGNVQTWGNKPSYGTTQSYVSGKNGRAALFAANGDRLSCEFSYDDDTAIGVCTSSKGERFDLVTKPQ
jgi:hypothetical protein